MSATKFDACFRAARAAADGSVRCGLSQPGSVPAPRFWLWQFAVWTLEKRQPDAELPFKLVAA